MHSFSAASSSCEREKSCDLALIASIFGTTSTFATTSASTRAAGASGGGNVSVSGGVSCGRGGHLSSSSSAALVRRRTFHGHGGPIWCLAYDRTHDRVFSGSYDKTIKVGR